MPRSLPLVLVFVLLFKATAYAQPSAHAGMGIRKVHFTALVQDLQKTLRKFKVPMRERPSARPSLSRSVSSITSPGSCRETKTEPSSATAALDKNPRRGFIARPLSSAPKP